jgi:hypothetical protein
VVYYSNSRPVGDATVLSMGSATLSAETDDTGLYELQLPPDTWLIEPFKSGDAGNAITAMDASYVLQGIYGSRWLSPQQQLACDVNGNGRLDLVDASLIMLGGAGKIRRFPVADLCGSDWAFDPAPAFAPDQQSIRPRIGDQGCQPGTIAVRPLNSLDNQTFQAILFGDCTGNWQPPKLGGLGGDSVRDLRANIRLGRMRHSRTGRMWMPVYVGASEPIFAVDLQLRYDPNRIQSAGVRVFPGFENVIVASHEQEPGLLRAAVAGARPIPLDRGAVAALYFRQVSGAGGASIALRGNRAANRATMTPVRIDEAYVDEVALQNVGGGAARTDDR